MATRNLLPDSYSGATGQPGHFTEGFLLRRLHGCWIAKEMQTELRPGHFVDAIGAYNTKTGEFKYHEGMGELLEGHCEQNPDDDDELSAIYMEEAQCGLSR